MNDSVTLEAIFWVSVGLAGLSTRDGRFSRVSFMSNIGFLLILAPWHSSATEIPH